jgi:hypothetical protein
VDGAVVGAVTGGGPADGGAVGLGPAFGNDWPGVEGVGVGVGVTVGAGGGGLTFSDGGGWVDGALFCAGAEGATLGGAGGFVGAGVGVTTGA